MTTPRNTKARRVVVESQSDKQIAALCYQLEAIYCGKSCKGCPHGPYWYGYFRCEGRVETIYIGRELDKRKAKQRMRDQMGAAR